MKGVGICAAWLCVVCGAGANAQSAIDKQLMRLDPHTRMIQVCDLSGLKAFARDKSIKAADRVRVNALSPPKVQGNVISGSGGALRSDGDWIAFSFTCEVAADQMRATAFHYEIGKAIPPGQWEKYNLWK